MSWKMTLEQLITGTKGKAVSSPNQSFRGVGTDTRVDLNGKIFIALKGDTFDANDFLEKALAAGASAVVTHRLPPEPLLSSLNAKTSLVLVDDTLKALQDLGQFWRLQMPAKIIGVTGTNGKTTTKEFTAAILDTKFNVQYSKGSFNNHWGVPISLLTIEPEHEIAIIEMGMNHAGEIKRLVEIALPDMVAVTMVGRGHLEGMGSIEGVASAKEEIYLHSNAGALRIFNLDNPHTAKMFESAKAGKYGKGGAFLTFGNTKDADVSFKVLEATASDLKIEGSIRGVQHKTTVPVFGAHNVNNLMLASCFALACGMSPQEIWEALPDCRSGWGRNQWVNLASGGRVLFDAYNANPESMAAALKNFSAISAKPGGKKIAVLAEMREMGDNAVEVHREMGEVAGRCDFDAVYFYGPSSAEFKAGALASGFLKSLIVSNSYEELLALSGVPVISPADIVLMKGSRGMQLERMLKEWKPTDFAAKT